MSAIRPLATIAALMVLGYFLWTRINTPTLEATTEGQFASADLPPLSLDLGENANPMESNAPPFNPTDSTAGAPPAEFDFGPTPEPPATTAAAPREEPATGSQITPLVAADTAAMPDLPPLPANVPTADYSSDSPAANTVSGRVPSLGTEVPAPTTTEPLPPLSESDMVAGAMPQAPVVPEEFAPTAPEQESMRMGVEEEFAPPASAFASARPAIDAALQRGELERAHVLLSGWYGDRSLTPEEREEVETLLSQLAGSVVYSPEHRLESPHTVQPDETLETIAQKYDVPWQLLAKINGVPSPSAVTPGQELKVVRGPFSAVVDVERQQLALMVADRYAGKFSVKTEGQATSDGEWVVTQKQMPQSYGSTSKQMMLEPAGGGGATALMLGPPSDATSATDGAIRVGPSDQEDLFDILSIGSRVIIRR